MTQREALLYSFRISGGRMRLKDILSYPWGYEFRARASELRNEGYVVNYYKGKTPSDNLYEIIAPEKSGQMRLA